MKTKNNVQKAVLRSGAVIISFVLISFTVSAQDFWKKLITNSSFNEIAIAMVDTKEPKLPANTSEANANFNLNALNEPVLQLEDWMTNENYFGNSAYLLEKETDYPLQLENWMLDENNFTTEEDDRPLQLEAWMIADNYWNM